MYKKVSLSATVVVYAKSTKKVLVIRRKKEPFKDFFAFPGGFLEAEKETIEQAAVRELKEESGVSIQQSQLQLVDVRSSPKRDPRSHIIDVGFLCMLEKEVSIQKETVETVPEWMQKENIDKMKLAFDLSLLWKHAKDYLLP